MVVSFDFFYHVNYMTSNYDTFIIFYRYFVIQRLYDFDIGISALEVGLSYDSDLSLLPVGKG